ncbi:MAG: ATP-binding protein, partial [Thermodesulfobacteriota bacterium]|nr:ATP-binding protein [Thermodesulfobacteriota bacterium]
SKVALHYLRDKEKHEVDFLVLVDNSPVKMVEVKVGDDHFSSSLFRFHRYLKSAKPYQIVYRLKRKKSKGPARMVPAREFLRDLNLLDG